MKTFKRVISLLLVSCLLMFTLPTAFAADSGVAAVDETQEEDILDNPIFSGAIVEIVSSFLQSFAEIFQRYIEVIKAIIAEIDISELLPPATTPDTPEVPDTGDEDTPSEETPSEGTEGSDEETGNEEVQPAA